MFSSLCVVGHEMIKRNVRLGHTAGLEGGYLAMLSIPIWGLTLILAIAAVVNDARRVATWAYLVLAVVLPLFPVLGIWTALVRQLEGIQ